VDFSLATLSGGDSVRLNVAPAYRRDYYRRGLRALLFRKDEYAVLANRYDMLDMEASMS
jgi:hypothetical protein